jgi:hypothetical protein
VNFFFDRNISEHFARMLDAYDRNNSISHQDRDARFTPETDDVTLIRTVGGDDPKPVWVSADVSQYQRFPAERLALVESGMHAVFFRAGFHNQSFRDQAIKLLTVWDNVARQCATARAPTLFEVGSRIHSNKVEAIGPMSGL